MHRLGDLLRAGLGLQSLLLWFLLSCPACDEGQDIEPTGPLALERVTLLDATRRNVTIFTDTSAPADCNQPADPREATRCATDPRSDQDSLSKSPPTPNSGQQIRAVFNKIPYYVNGALLETANLRRAIQLVCSSAGCVPPRVSLVTLQVSGSSATGDPVSFPYGPALQIEVGKIACDDDSSVTDSGVTLEPGATYFVQLAAGLASRDGAPMLPADARLLSFTVEPFHIRSVGNGDSDTEVWGDPQSAALTPTPVLDNDGVLVLRLNAPIDAARALTRPITASVGGVPVAVTVSVSGLTPAECRASGYLGLFIHPKSGRWAARGIRADVHIAFTANQICSGGGHCLGAAADLRIAALSGKDADGGPAPAGCSLPPWPVSCPGQGDLGVDLVGADIPISTDAQGARDAAPVDMGTAADLGAGRADAGTP